MSRFQGWSHGNSCWNSAEARALQAKPGRVQKSRARDETSLQQPQWTGFPPRAVRAGNVPDPFLQQGSFLQVRGLHVNLPGSDDQSKSLHLDPGYCPANETEARVSGGFWGGFSVLMKRDILGRVERLPQNPAEQFKLEAPQPDWVKRCFFRQCRLPSSAFPQGY